MLLSYIRYYVVVAQPIGVPRISSLLNDNYDTEGNIGLSLLTAPYNRRFFIWFNANAHIRIFS